MAFGDLAREALAEAMKAYKAALTLEVSVKAFETAFVAFEQRVNERLRASEDRIYQLQLEVASLRGKVDGGYSTAVANTLLNPENQRLMAERLASQQALQTKT